MRKLIIDRIEGSTAVCECGHEMVNISITDLPCDAKEGSIIIEMSDGTFVIDRKSTKSRSEEVLNLQDTYFTDE